MIRGVIVIVPALSAARRPSVAAVVAEVVSTLEAARYAWAERVAAAGVQVAASVALSPAAAARTSMLRQTGALRGALHDCLCKFAR